MSVPTSVKLPASVRNQLIGVVLERYPLKSFGFLASPEDTHHPTEFLRLEDNIRNDDQWRDEFESRGRYFVDHSDAGFVATPEESWRAERYLAERDLDEVAVFHTHRRHPGNFSGIDYDLHISRFQHLWHLIISLRKPDMPQLRAFDVSLDGVREMPVDVVDE